MFKDVIGQEHIKRHLIRSVQEGRVPHAQLFVGVSGVGKLQMALAYAQYLNCANRSEYDACGVCPSCRKYATLEHPDLHFVFPIEKKGSVSCCDHLVKEFREIIRERGYFDETDWNEQIGSTKQTMIYSGESEHIVRKLNFKAYEAPYKVMIIWLPEKMNIDCANKILKILEEPAERTLLLMLSEEPEKLLTTIRSRTQIIQFPLLPEEDIFRHLQEHYPDQSTSHLSLIAHTSRGSYTTAVRQLTQEEGNPYLVQFIELMRKSWLVGFKKDYTALVQLWEWVDVFASSNGREKQKEFLQYSQVFIRENFIRNMQEPELNYMTEEELAFSKNFSPFVNGRNVEELSAEFALAERHIEQNVNSKIVLFDLMLKVIVLLKR